MPFVLLLFFDIDSKSRARVLPLTLGYMYSLPED